MDISKLLEELHTEFPELHKDTFKEGKYDSTNLAETNSYYEILNPFKVIVTSKGQGRPDHLRVTAPKGWIIMNLVGGTFLGDPATGKTWFVRMDPRSDESVFPLQNLKQLPTSPSKWKFGDLLPWGEFNLTEESQLDMGKNVEKEHKPTVEWVKDEVESTGKVPLNKEIYASIAKDHIDEFPTYYTALDKMEKELKESIYKKGDPDYDRVMSKWNSRQGIRMDDLDSEILKKILSDSAWDEEISNEAEDYAGLNEGVGDFLKGATKQVGKNIVGGISKAMPGVGKAIQAGQEASQQAASNEAVLQASDINGYLNKILTALQAYVTKNAPAAPQQDTATQPGMLPESFDLYAALHQFEKEHMTEAMDKATFVNLVGQYVKKMENDPSKILADPQNIKQLQGIFGGAKKFGLQMPVTQKEFDAVIAAHNAATAPAGVIAGEAIQPATEPVAVAPQQTAATRYARMKPNLVNMLQDPEVSESTMRIIADAFNQVRRLIPGSKSAKAVTDLQNKLHM